MDASIPSLADEGATAPAGALAPAVPSAVSVPTAPTVPGAVDETQVLRFGWTGSPWSLFGTCLFNGLMTLVTVGVYSFWGRTEIRRRTWGSVRLDGEPLAYHGTGGELCKGFLAALAIVLLPLFLVSTWLVVTYGQGSPSWATYQLLLFLFVYPVLKALAQYRARRYRLARTSWRGVRGSMTGSPGEFAFLTWATSLLYPLTLGWIAPWRALYVQRFLVGDTVLGDRRLKFNGSTAKLYLSFGLLWVGTLALVVLVAFGIGAVLGEQLEQLDTLDAWKRVARAQWLEVGGVLLAALFFWSLASSFYRATLYNTIANGTVLMAPDGSGLPALRFKLRTRGLALIWLFVTNSLISYGTLFALRPIATARSMRYFARNLWLVGAFDPALLRQNSTALLSEGEGLAQAFDFDAF